MFSNSSDATMEFFKAAFQQLSQQISELRTEMNARFDEVMKSLNIIFKTMFDLFWPSMRKPPKFLIP